MTLFTLSIFNIRILNVKTLFHILLFILHRYVSNIDKIIDDAPSDPTQDFKTQVWVSSPIV